MKRIIAAVSFALITAPAFAAEIGLPYEQTQLDRALPQVPQRLADERAPSAFGAPYEQTRLDRALPDVEPQRKVFAAYSGDTRSDLEIATDTSGAAPWTTDHNFIAPAQ